MKKLISITINGLVEEFGSDEDMEILGNSISDAIAGYVDMLAIQFPTVKFGTVE